MNEKRKILVTSALPYANGDIHLGHLVEYLQTDFWVRFQKLRGHECRYMCADDTHGTPVMISARNKGITPEELIQKKQEAHLKDFIDFHIQFDNFYTTNSPENKAFSEEIYKFMLDNGHIETKNIKQFYCLHDKMFLPDRFVTGTCPRCGSEDQYGDSCDKCSATYSSFELKNPRCTLCDNKPVEKESEHVFFKLNNLKEFLNDWVKKHTSPEVYNKLQEWLVEDLRDWDISRDAPYFGFKIPGYDDKYFYVWLDAPIGYISATKNWCDKNNRKFEEFWKEDNNTELYHFIGKDIVYFHTLFWPAMLHNAGYKTPNAVFVHGFLTVNGEKMSKSKGTFITARTYLEHSDPKFLRYYYACKMTSTLDDIDLNFEDFIQRVNSDLVGKITNLASRGMQMLNKIDNKIDKLSQEAKQLIKYAQDKADEIAAHYENRNFNRAMISIREIADQANKYFDEKAPWKSLKTDIPATKDTLGAVINVFRIICIYITPVLPEYAKAAADILNQKPFTWQDIDTIMEDQEIKKYIHLSGRIDKKEIEKIIEESKSNQMEEQNKTEESAFEELEPTITYDDFAKLDLRVAKILEAEEIEEADKLIRLKIDIGLEQRTIIAGIKKAYKAADLIDRQIIVVANLAPRKMKFGTSEGMLLAAGPGGSDIFLLGPDSGAVPGQRIH